MLGLIDELFMESDYIVQYESIDIKINNNTRFSHVRKDPVLIKAYQELADSKEVKRLPYFDPIAQKFLYRNVIIEYVNVLYDYVELVISVI